MRLSIGLFCLGVCLFILGLCNKLGFSFEEGRSALFMFLVLALVTFVLSLGSGRRLGESYKYYSVN